ncbi:type B DNA-directed DNA polymerase [Halolamina sp. CBA1230]|uniref:type B DNA-directed DNA polymerase n=1 Tax=Halolamina sp. CBA1230 TaxID=1853690 RepID=UPI0009A2171C|nr:type B DNA-directed DNA polymerase [Halolamina sp. CBA1230]QKY19438.1 type B DNA-directed DNA polymerase [Halolamina sp. CBA1230]
MTYCIDFPEPETAVEWSLTDAGVEREERPYRPRFYVRATADGSLAEVADAVRPHPEVAAVEREHHRPGWRHDATEMLAVEMTTPDAVSRLASTITKVGRPGTYRCFNVDLSRQFRYCVETGTEPTPTRDPTVLELAAPPIAGSGLESVTATTPSGETHAFADAPADIARDVESLIRRTEPDVLRVSTAELLPELFDAVEEDLRLGREPGYTQLAAASTYESYGTVGHSPARYAVPGRPIVDASNSFFLRETDLDGVRYLVERSHKPLQEAAWASIGNVLTAIQIREALSRDVLVPWRSWRAERFKPASTLETADRGGFTLSPDVGVHENVHELDFSSLYPNIMCTRNISPETVCCDCHPEREDVPELGYGICPDDGYLPDVLQPLIDDRDEFKRRLGRGDDGREGAAAAIKWILVSCFGYQGFSNAKFGRIECHEAINAFAREILLDAKATLEHHGWRVVHGIVDSLWVTPMPDREGTDLETVAREITDDAGIRLEYEAAYDWLAFCPRRDDGAGALTRYFGKRAGDPVDDESSYKRRGIEARQRSTPPFVEDAQLELIREFGRTRSPEAVCESLREFVRDLRSGDVDPARLAITNRVSKRVEEYTQTTKNVAALERAADLGLEKHPGQTVEYVVVDDEKSGRARVALLHENPDRYDIAFYRDRLCRAAESVLAPAGFRREEIEEQLSERVNGSLSAF